MKRLRRKIDKSHEEVSYQKVLFVPDIHAPYQDKKCLESLITFIKYFNPEIIFIMGDCVDFYAVSKFVKDPLRALRLQKEIDEAHDILKQIRDAAKNAKITLIRGNHEARMQKYLWTTAKELSGLRSMEVSELLGLSELDIKYANTGRVDFKEIIVKHGSIVRKFSAYTAKGEMENHGVSGVSVHTHRAGVNYLTNDSGYHVWFELGCICKLQADYLEGQTPNWQQGWGVGYFKNHSRRFQIEFIPYVCGKAFYQGREF